MNKYFKIIAIVSFALVVFSCSTKVEPLMMVFSSNEEVSTFNWKLDDFSPALPDDWTNYNYLILEMRASTPERFSMGPITPEGAITKTIRPFPGAWLRFCVPLEYYRQLPAAAHDMAATYNKGRTLGQINLGGRGINPVTKVEGLNFSMRNPINNPTLEIRAAYLSVESVRDTVLQEGYLVDRYGQWATQDWSGKIKTDAQLRQEWNDETASFKPINTEKYSP
jgi:hypothetical protein